MMRKHIKLIILAFLIMTIFGFIENVKGVIIPEIRIDFSVDYSSIGLMLFLSTLGYMTATFLGGIAGDRFGEKRVLSAGFILIMLALFFVRYIDSFWSFVLLIFVINAGFGCFEIGANSLGAKIFIKNSAFMMNLLHLFYGVGSSIGPRYAGWLLSHNYPWPRVYFYLLFLVLGIFIYLLFSPFPEDDGSLSREKIPLKVIVRDKKVWLFVGVLGFSEVAELGISNWLVNFLQVIRGMNEAGSSFFLSLFFITFTIGRLLGGFLTEVMGYVRIIFYFTTMTIVLFAGGLLFKGIGPYLFSFTGFFVSILFPTIMAIIMKEFKQGTSSVMGFIITTASGINMISNWLIGKSNDLFGVLPGFASIIIYALMIIILLVILNRRLSYEKLAKRP